MVYLFLIQSNIGFDLHYCVTVDSPVLAVISFTIVKRS